MIKIVPTWVWLTAIAVTGVASGVIGYNKGQDNIQGKWDAEKAATALTIARLEKNQGKVTYVTETKLVEVEKLITVKGDTLVKYVDRFIPSGEGCTTDGMLSGQFRVLYNGAVTNTVPDTATIAAGIPVAVADVARNATYNYTQCNKAYARVTAWEEWADGMCKLNEDGCPDGR